MERIQPKDNPTYGEKNTKKHQIEGAGSYRWKKTFANVFEATGARSGKPGASGDMMGDGTLVVPFFLIYTVHTYIYIYIVFSHVFPCGLLCSALLMQGFMIKKKLFQTQKSGFLSKSKLSNSSLSWISFQTTDWTLKTFPRKPPPHLVAFRPLRIGSRKNDTKTKTPGKSGQS